MTTAANTDDNVVQMRPARANKDNDKQADKKWSKPVMKLGYTIVPALLLRAQKRLGLTPQHLNLILQIAEHWWKAEALPFPGKTKIAHRMGCTPRHVQRLLTDLEKCGYLQRVERTNRHGSQMSNYYSLGGLVKRLEELAPEFQREADEREQNRAAVERRGGRQRQA
jgi:hypothetical protein